LSVLVVHSGTFSVAENDRYSDMSRFPSQDLSFCSLQNTAELRKDILRTMSQDAISQAGWIEAIAACGTLLISLVAAAYAIREHRSSRESFVQDMRQQWKSLESSWSTILMAIEGHDYHYVDASRRDRFIAKRLNQKLQSTNADHGYDAGLDLRRSVRPVTRFLSYAADSLLRGRWTVQEAYDIFGPDLGRHYKILRFLAHRDDYEFDWVVQSTEFNNFDEQDCVFLFAFLIRAEQCRRGDTYGHLIVELSEEMRGDYRHQLLQCIYRVTRVRHRPLPSGVCRTLYRGTHPSVASAYCVPNNPQIESSQLKVFRIGFEPLFAVRLRIRLARYFNGKDRQIQPNLD